jgi:HK97 family phage portal protein
MNPFSRLFGRKDAPERIEPQPPEIKYSQAGTVVSSHIVGQPRWTEHDYAHLSREAYVLNPVGFRCIKMISVCAATIAWQLHGRDRTLIEDHAILDLLTRPSPMQGGSSLFEAAYSYFLASGNNYFEANGPNGKPPRELFALRPDRMKVVPGTFGLPSEFVYEHAGNKRTWPVNPMTGESQILHIKDFHPTDDWYGLARTIPGAKGIDRHSASSDHNKALLDNGARPSGGLVFEPVEVGGQVQMADPEIVDKAYERLEQMHMGSKNAGRPMVLNGKIKWEQFGLSPSDMDFDENKQDAARDICLAFGVPHVLIVKGESTYNNIREAKLQLYEDTVLPLVDHFLDELNNWLVPRFGDGLKLAADLDSIPALEPRREAKRKSVVELVEKNVLDQDEAREELGYGPRNENAVRKIDGSVLTALVKGAEAFGLEPLIRYMLSVGLVKPGTKPEDIAAAALDLIEGDDQEDDDENNPADEDDDADNDEDIDDEDDDA